ncbi:MAG: glycoside hydrolase family 97 catalytic domain-containing protein, partial [Cyclobacteriaceae bacterium]
MVSRFLGGAFVFGLLLSPAIAKALPDTFEVLSPDKKMEVLISTANQLTYQLRYKDVLIMGTSRIGLQLSDRRLGDLPKVKSFRTSKYQGAIPLPYGKSRKLTESYNQLVLQLEGDYELVVRAYNEGMAYRLQTILKDSVVILNEDAEFNLEGAYAVAFPETNVFTSWEVPFKSYSNVNAIAQSTKAITPVLFTSQNTSVVIAESDLFDYPGMYLKKTTSGFQGTWAPYPKRTELGSWGNFVSVVKETENNIAKTIGTRSFPWRVIIATDDDKSLLSNELVYKLASPLAIQDASWIRPGKATWEWWHDAMVEDAGIPSGMDNRNTALYKHYIDFAAANKLEYLMLDAGWSNIFDLSKIQEKNDIHELIRYGKEKHVDIFLWCVATTLMSDLDRYMAMLSDWGVAGIKVDFFDRDDQEAISWYKKIAASAAKYQLMVNFHGCSKPTGLERAFPNIVNYEAVRGAESNKWDRTVDPDQNMMTLFSRMLAGPLDYTPGSMRNKTRETFKPIDPGLPSTQGTRCHELAMYILFHQPFAMLCDSPAEYRKYPDIMEFLSLVPTVFDETKVVQAKANEVAVIAKRSGNTWYLG